MKIFTQNLLITIIVLISALSYSNANNKTEVKMPPKAKKIEKKLTIHGNTRIDNYYWMNQRDDKEVIDYLEAENKYVDEVMADTEELQETIFEEITSRIPKDDESVPYLLNGYYYRVKYEKGKEFPIYVRMKGDINAKEELILDVNEIAEGHEYCSVVGLSISPNNKMVSYGVDLVSRRQYIIHFKNLETGEVLENKIENTPGGTIWANDNKTVFFSRKNELTLRSEKIYTYNLETNQEKEIYFEADETFTVSAGKSRSKQYIIIGSSSTLSDEYRIIDANNPDSDFKLFNPRKRGLEYTIDHAGDNFYILTNDKAKNFRVMVTPEDATEQSNWKELVPGSDDTLLEDITLFKDFFVLEERSNALTRIKIMNYDGTEDHYIDISEPVYTSYLSQNAEYDTDLIRYTVFTLKDPRRIYDYNAKTKEQKLLKQDVVVGDFNPDDYVQERIYAIARDGVKIPISIVHKKGIELNGKNPTMLYGYGSYGYSMDPYFSYSLISLLDRGFVYAIAHIRGGQEMGRNWYEDGKLLNKKNTFYDFIDTGKHLISQNYTDAEHLTCMGGSAGGLLVGAVVNMQPDIFKAMIAKVPFVDVVTTMLDESIPLTTGEYDEWGNPNNKEYYEYMLSYSPYDNIQKQDYPNILITTGYHDSQVQYWEPAKWTAKLRELKTDDNLLLFKTDMATGHGGKSGRFKRYRDTALDYAFLLKVLGMTDGK